MIRYAYSRTDDDCWPIMFQPHCERTWPTLDRPDGEGLLELIQRLDRGGYDLIGQAELERRVRLLRENKDGDAQPRGTE